jgi:endonuclease YncB( thermonuclease family)
MFSSISRYIRSICCCFPKQELIAINNKNVKKNKNIKNNKNDKNILINKVDKKKAKYNNVDDILDIDDTSYLNNIDYKDTIPFIPPIKYGKVIKVYDGDTLTIAAKLPFKGSPIYRFSVRLAGIDSAEIRGGTANESEIAKIARDALHKLIFGKIVELRGNGKEKYGRLLADLYYNDGDSNCKNNVIHINQWMIDNGYAVSYDGGKKNRPPDWEK